MVNHPGNRYVMERLSEFRRAELEARARKHAALAAAGIAPRRSLRGGFAATLRRIADRLEPRPSVAAGSRPCPPEMAADA